MLKEETSRERTFYYIGKKEQNYWNKALDFVKEDGASEQSGRIGLDWLHRGFI